MGLFQKQPITNTRVLYELESDKTLLIAGLGNIGKKYEGTRHNAGFLATDAFADSQEFPDWSVKKSLNCELTVKPLNNMRIILAKPSTYMNDSGKAVSALQRYYKISNPDTLIISDELDLDFGKLRTRQGGSPGGHKGLESIIGLCSDNFCRLRIGIGPKKSMQIDNADFVLQKFSKNEVENMDKLLKETTSLISEFIYNNGKIHPETRSFIV